MSEKKLKDIKAALANDEFVFYYQPKISMQSGVINGAEALIRWIKPDGTIIPPFEFIPLAEETGFITEITFAMLDKAIDDLRTINELNPDLIISINASAKDFQDDKLIDKFEQKINEGKLCKNKIEVELTETAFCENESITDRLYKLQKLGVSLSMDDFGTGYSSIDILSRFPFTTLKLDQGVISRMVKSEKDRIIVRLSIQMAHQLGMETVAEGVETEAVYYSLQNMGCTHVQGYWCSKPIALPEFLELVNINTCWSGGPIGMLHLAQTDHILWRKQIIDICCRFNTETSLNINSLSIPEINPKACRLGKWYYGTGQSFSGVKWFDDLEEPHNKLHELAERLLYNLNGDDKAKLLDEITSQSVIIINMLQSIENKFITSRLNDN